MNKLDQLDKEDRRHVELLYQLKRNEAFLATISQQLDNSIEINTTEFLSLYVERNEKAMNSIIERLSN